MNTPLHVRVGYFKYSADSLMWQKFSTGELWQREIFLI